MILHGRLKMNQPGGRGERIASVPLPASEFPSFIDRRLFRPDEEPLRVINWLTANSEVNPRVRDYVPYFVGTIALWRQVEYADDLREEFLIEYYIDSPRRSVTRSAYGHAFLHSPGTGTDKFDFSDNLLAKFPAAVATTEAWQLIHVLDPLVEPPNDVYGPIGVATLGEPY